jgi:hypothetical protein
MCWPRLLLVILALLCAPRPAQAEARLLMLAPEEQRARPTLVEALRLHLRGTARVESSSIAFPAGTAAQRVALAASLVQSAHADFALWLESVALSDRTTLFALYVVGGRPGRAIVEVVRLPAEDDGPDIDRALALKASEVIEAALSAPIIIPANQPAPSPSPSPVAALTAPRWGLELSAALRGVSSLTDSEAGLGVGVSRLLVLQPLELDARLGTTLLSDSVVNGARRVRLSESDVALGFGIRSNGIVQLGARFDLDVRLLRAQGFAGDAETGSALVVVPGVSLGPELRLRLGRHMSFGALIGAEWMIVRQSFRVDGVSAADLGRIRGNAQLSLMFFPF